MKQTVICVYLACSQTSEPGFYPDVFMTLIDRAVEFRRLLSQALKCKHPRSSDIKTYVTIDVRVADVDRVRFIEKPKILLSFAKLLCSVPAYFIRPVITALIMTLLVALELKKVSLENSLALGCLVRPSLVSGTTKQAT